MESVGKDRGCVVPPAAEMDASIPAEVTFQMPLGDLLALMPPHYLAKPPGDVSLQGSVAVTVVHLMEHLSRGRATMSVAELAAFVPPSILHEKALDDRQTLVTLPLSAVVAAVGLDRFRAVMRRKAPRHRYRIDRLDDPFKSTAGPEYQWRQILVLLNRVEIAGATPHAEVSFPVPEALVAGHSYLLTMDYQTSGRAQASVVIRPQHDKLFTPVRLSLPDDERPRLVEHTFTPTKDCPSCVLILSNSAQEGSVAITGLTLHELIPQTGAT